VVPVALDEWNYWYGPYVYGELGTQYFLQDALGVAAALNEYARQSDVFFMANYAQTVNVIGAIKTSKTAAVLDSTGVVLALYRKHFGGLPVAVSGSPEPLDVMACLKEDGKALVLSVVNPTERELALRIKTAGARLPRRAALHFISGSDPRACNVPARPPQVFVVTDERAPFGRRIKVPPMSASLYEVKLVE
jgi:alpha-N-arabinofuranosidase